MQLNKGNRPTLMFLPLTIGSYDAAGEAECTVQIPTDANFAACGLVVDNEVRLYDHRVQSMKHSEYDAIRRDDVDSSKPGVPLAHVASYLRHEAMDAKGAISTLTALVNSLDGATAATGTIADLADPADTPASADALRDDLVANFIPDVVNAINELATRNNAINANVAAIKAAIHSFTHRPFQPWPGRFNDPTPVLRRIAMGARTAQDDLRLALSEWIPGNKPTTLWPLHSGEEFNVRVDRIYGSASISKMYVAVVRLPEPIHSRLCDKREYIDYPRWYSRFWDLASTAGVESATIDRIVNFSAKWGFRWLQTFASGYDNNSGTVVYDESAVNTILLNHNLRSQGQLLPNIANFKARASVWCPQSLQNFDPSLDPGIVVAHNDEILADIEREASSNNSRDVYASYYGLLRPQDSVGTIADIE